MKILNENYAQDLYHTADESVLKGHDDGDNS